MKKTNLTLLAVAFLAAGCGDKSPEELILGTWNCDTDYSMGPVTANESHIMTFDKDGTFTDTAKTSVDLPKGTISIDYNSNGDWSLSENKLISTTTGGEVTSANPANHPFVKMVEGGLTKGEPKGADIVTLTEDEFSAQFTIPGMPEPLAVTCNR